MFFFLQHTCLFGMNKNYKNVTLQVRIPIWNLFSCGKRTFLSAILWKRGSLTVEASFVFPLFLFAMMTMMMPFSIMNRQRQVQAVMESVCEDLSRLAYAGYELKENKTDIKLPEEGLELAFGANWLEKSAIMAFAEVLIRKKLSTIQIHKLSLLKSEILEDEETINLIAEYELKMPFSILGISGIAMTSRSCRRAWIGKEGGWLEGGRGESNDEVVYIGKNSTRYHQIRTCHYLYNKLSNVSRDVINDQRNSDGKRYHPCSVCGGGSGAQVYIMPSGTSYHGSPSCTSIISYVKAVKKSEVAHLGACSYCSGG